MRKLLHRRSAASAVSYGLVLALIAIASLLAISATGQSVAALLGLAGNRLGGDAALPPEAPGTPVLSVTPETGDGLDISAPMAAPAFGVPTVFTVANSGRGAAPALQVTLSGDFVFAGSGDGCSGRVLAAGQSCTVTLQARATDNGSMLGVLQVEGLPEVPLSGTASGFGPRLDFADDATVLTVDSACTAILAQNSGTAPATGVSFGFAGADAASFAACTQVTTPCGDTLAAGSSCNFGVRLVAPDDGTFEATAQLVGDGGLSASRPVTAEVVSTDECEAGWTRFDGNNHCYRLSDAEMQRRDAYIDCSNRGGYLASVTDAGEDAFLIQMFRDSTLSGDTDAWIGLTRTGPTEQSFVWDSGEAISYTDWRQASGEPNGDTTEFCGTYARVGSDIGWNDLYCSASKRYFCEKLPRRTASSAPQPTCPAGWYLTRATGHCYRRYDNQMPFADAESFCEGQGGYLATITGDVENGYLVANLLYQQAWVGLHRSAPHVDEWQWVSGESSGYRHWGSGEPNDRDDQGNPDGEACVQFNDDTAGNWNDFSCIRSRSFVCERPL